LVAISFSELHRCYWNVWKILELGGIPLHNSYRLGCIYCDGDYLKPRCCVRCKNAGKWKADNRLLRRNDKYYIIISCELFLRLRLGFFGKLIWRQHFEKPSVGKTRAPFIDPPPPRLHLLRLYLGCVRCTTKVNSGWRQSSVRVRQRAGCGQLRKINIEIYSYAAAARASRKGERLSGRISK